MRAPSVDAVDAARGGPRLAPVARLDPDPPPSEGQRVRVVVEGVVEPGRHDGTQACVDLPDLGHLWVGRPEVTLTDPDTTERSRS